MKYWAVNRNFFANFVRRSTLDWWSICVSVKLLSKKTTDEQKRLLENKLKKLTETFEYLVQITTTKTVKLKEANRQRLYYTAYEDFKFWLSSVEVQLQETNYGKDLATVSNQRKKHAYFEEGVRLHADQLRDLNTLADECIAAQQFDPVEVSYSVTLKKFFSFQLSKHQRSTICFVLWNWNV